MQPRNNIAHIWSRNEDLMTVQALLIMKMLAELIREGILLQVKDARLRILNEQHRQNRG